MTPLEVDALRADLQREEGGRDFQIFNPEGPPVSVDPNTCRIDQICYEFRCFWHGYFWRKNDCVMIMAELDHSHHKKGKFYGIIRRIKIMYVDGHHVPLVGVQMATRVLPSKVNGNSKLEIPPYQSNPELPNHTPIRYWRWVNIIRPVTFHPSTRETLTEKAGFIVIDFDRPYPLNLDSHRWIRERFLKIKNVIAVKHGGPDLWLAGVLVFLAQIIE